MNKCKHEECDDELGEVFESAEDREASIKEAIGDVARNKYVQIHEQGRWLVVQVDGDGRLIEFCRTTDGGIELVCDGAPCGLIREPDLRAQIGDLLAVPAGTYTLWINGEPPVTFDEVLSAREQAEGLRESYEDAVKRDGWYGPSQRSVSSAENRARRLADQWEAQEVARAAHTKTGDGAAHRSEWEGGNGDEPERR
jgi:hypothetical protein